MWRDRFRGSAAHNTVRVDGRDQADAAGPFRWLNKPSVEVRSWETGTESDQLEAACASTPASGTGGACRFRNRSGVG